MSDARRPYPEADGETGPFWDGIAEGRLRIQRCGACGRHVLYPRSVCPFCTTGGLEWVDASGRGTVHSFTVVHLAAPGFEGEAPYAVVLVDLAEGPRLMTRLLGVDAHDVRIGMAVELEVAGDPPLPYFRRSES